MVDNWCRTLYIIGVGKNTSLFFEEHNIMSKWDYLDDLYEEFESVVKIKKEQPTNYDIAYEAPKKKAFKRSRELQRRQKERNRD